MRRRAPPPQKPRLPILRFSAQAALALLILASGLRNDAEAAPCPPARVPPSPEYLDLVTRYAAGEHVVTMDALGSWDADRLNCDLDNLKAAAVAVRRCRGDCEDRRVFEQFSVRAAILLHGDKEAFEQFGVPASEQISDCGTGKDARVVERLADLLVVVDPEAKSFLSRFYRGMTRRAHWSHCLAQAEQWARAGRARVGDDPTLLLTLGIVAETTAFLTVVPAPRNATLGPRAARQFEALSARISGLWDKARRHLEEAVKADPGQLEARLRLGRVLWRLKRPEPARPHFEAVLTGSDDPSLLYLAHLFLGRIHEDADALAEAVSQYQAALLIQPRSETAAVALSHARLLLGDAVGARETLLPALRQLRRRSEVDPYHRYPMAHAAEGHTTLAELRRSVAP